VSRIAAPKKVARATKKAGAKKTGGKRKGGKKAAKK